MNNDEYVNERLLQHAAEHELMRRREALQEARKIVEMDGLGPIGPADEFPRDICATEIPPIDSPYMEQRRAIQAEQERLMKLDHRLTWWKVGCIVGWAAFLAVIVVAAMR